MRFSLALLMPAGVRDIIVGNFFESLMISRSSNSLIWRFVVLFSVSSSSTLRRNTDASCSFSSSRRRNSAGSSSSDIPSSFSSGDGTGERRDGEVGLNLRALIEGQPRR